MAKEAIKIVEKTENPKRKRKHRDMSISEIIPEPFSAASRTVWMLCLIPISIVVGIAEGICQGFVKGLEKTLGMYRKELEQ